HRRSGEGASRRQSRPQRRAGGARRAAHGAGQTRAEGAVMATGGKAKDARKANKRGAARLAAVQALYQMDVAGTGLNDILAEVESHLIGREGAGAQDLAA